MKILAIGNSFSQDATRYLHQIARAAGDHLEVFNLYVPGCPLHRHYRNMLGDKREYLLEVNGQITNFAVSMQEALLSQKWDVITLQQVSYEAPHYETYQPYLSELAAYVRKLQPEAKILLHETWAYEGDTPRLRNKGGYETPEAMTADLKTAYYTAAQSIGADGVIPGGEVLLDVLHRGVASVHRDTAHASYGVGRYALGLIWYRCLFDKPVADNPFCDWDVPVTAEECAIAKAAVDSLGLVKVY